MTSKNETQLNFVIAVVCLIVGVFCYGVFPAKAPEMPVRVMFDAMVGNVLFDHQAHSLKDNLGCPECHHADVKGESEMPKPCGTCHQIDIEYKQAIGEGGMFDHRTHAGNYGLTCVKCHHDYVEGQPGGLEACGDCHLRVIADEFILNRMQAFHQQCIGCHEDMGVSPGKTNCAGCHFPRKRIDAFHNQCITCHEEMGLGPDEADCKVCHGY